MITPPPRLVSLDQFRGLTVLAMFFVNFAGQYPTAPTPIRHHDLHCTFADVIMPMFLFAVGLAMRMMFPKRVAKLGREMAYRKAIGRSIGLILLGIVIYHLTGEWTKWEELKSQVGLSMVLHSFKSNPFQTLVHIALASLFVLPVIESRPWVRLAFLILSGTAFLLIDLNGYHEWNRSAPAGIEGGPLGFLSWTIPLLFGTLCSDAVAVRASNTQIFLTGLLVCAVAIAIMAIGNPTAKWPFQRLNLETTTTANAYSMRANSATVTLTTFGAGIAFIVYALCRYLSDDRGLTLPLFELFGRNALAAYIIHDLVRQATVPFVPRDSPFWYVLVGTFVYFFITWQFVRYMDRQKLHLTL